MAMRMGNPAALVPEAMPALQALGTALWAAAEAAGVPKGMLFLCYLRVSQVNGDSVCVELHSRNARNAGESLERLLNVAAWRDTPFYTDAERAALALSEAVTRLSDRADAVPDDVYAEAARHYEEPALAVLLTGLATANLWNRLNVPTRQMVAPAG